MSKVQICNRGLSAYLGVGRINSLTETSAAAEQCDLHYDDALRALLEAHPWRFATGRQTLAEMVNDRSAEWSYQYARPADAIFVRWVNDAEVARYLVSQYQSPDAPREMTAGSIYSDVAYATCEFTKLVTDTTLYPQFFKDALSAALAANMAMPLTEDVRRARNAIEQAEAKLDKAIALDEQEEAAGGYPTIPSYLSERGVS